jgi:diguanylate cyclase (GGDEF)-like protein
LNRAEGDHHIACSLTSTLLQRVCAVSGETGVESVLAEASCPHSAAYLRDVSNWVSYDEAVALFTAAAEVTGDAGIARAAGEETVRQHAGTAVATVLRALGSPEKILEQVTTAVTKFSLVTEMQTLELEPGRALVRAQSRPGFNRDPYLCEWTQGLLSQPTVLFGLAPATVEESECQARGGSHCLYEVRWNAAQAAGALEPEQHITALEAQLAAMTDRVESVLASAADLIADTDLDTTLARITERAATAVRTPRYLLAVRPTAESELHCHHRGLTDVEAGRLVERLEQADESIPAGWLVAEVCSARRAYGRLVAIHDADVGFFDQERQLLAIYARYAATVLDRATALDAAQRGHDQAQALLGLARALAEAGGSDEVALRIVTALPSVVDCDRAALFLWDESAGEMRPAGATDEQLRSVRVRPADTPYLRRMLAEAVPTAFNFDENMDDPFLVGVLRTLGDKAGLAVPIAVRGTLLGVLTLGVTEHPERVEARPELLNLMSGVAAQAATALENGRLIDHITHQALHDGLTDLPNRQLFRVRLEEAVAAAEADDEAVALLYVDIDDFKAVNDEHGHATGDLLLRQVADRLALTIRAGDTVARLGGDEFAMVLAAISAPEEIDPVASRVRDAFEQPFVIEGASLRVSASVGRAVWPVDATEAEHLLRSADMAMYGVKRDRRARRGVARERRGGRVRR